MYEHDIPLDVVQVQRRRGAGRPTCAFASVFGACAVRRSDVQRFAIAIDLRGHAATGGGGSRGRNACTFTSIFSASAVRRGGIL
jgi:hypothetical protein